MRVIKGCDMSMKMSTLNIELELINFISFITSHGQGDQCFIKLADTSLPRTSKV